MSIWKGERIRRVSVRMKIVHWVYQLARHDRYKCFLYNVQIPVCKREITTLFQISLIFVFQEWWRTFSFFGTSITALMEQKIQSSPLNSISKSIVLFHLLLEGSLWCSSSKFTSTFKKKVLFINCSVIISIQDPKQKNFLFARAASLGAFKLANCR